MLFNSLEYLLFLPTVFCLYWFVFNKNLKVQNSLLLISSYVFYGWWDWRFLSLIFLSTIVDYFVGLKIYFSENKKTKKSYLWISILFNLGLLGFFKYFNFFIESWIDLLGVFGYESQSTWTLKVILPVGISFYTFQTMSYSLDIYHGKLKPTKDFISFSSFVSFFPQLVAGPIERASNLLPQILKNRLFLYNQGVQGCRLIIWGLFKKVVIADSLGIFVESIFNNFSSNDGGVLLLGLIYFSIQIYCDFSGYSDIAIGTAKLFGIELMSNFKFPYFSRDISEFWRRWHISLSSWFKDYLFIPLGGSIGNKKKSFINILIIFTVSGFWHGANWTFIMWGITHALLYLPLFFFEKNRLYTSSIVAENKVLPSLKELFMISTTFFTTTLAWVFFRSKSIQDSIEYLYLIFTNFRLPLVFSNLYGLIYVFCLFLFDWIIRDDERLENINKIISNHYLRHSLYIAILFLIILHSTKSTFIYFQF